MSRQEIMHTDTSTETTTINVKGTPLAVALRPGDGSGPPLLMLNGIGANLEVFEPFLTEKEQMAQLVYQFLRM